MAIAASSMKWTVTASVDDALLPAGGSRTVYVVNPDIGLAELRAFAEQEYPGDVAFIPINGETPWRAAFSLLLANKALNINLSQKDPRWKDEILGEGDETIGKAGCVLVCLTAALRMYGYDVMPPVVNRLLLASQSVFTGSYLANWHNLWKAAPVDRDVIYSSQKPSLSYIRSLLENGYEVILPNQSFTHYYLAIAPATRGIEVLDTMTGEVITLRGTTFGGVRAFRVMGGRRQFAVSYGHQDTTPPVGPPVIREGRLVTAHLQSPIIPSGCASYLPGARSVKTLCPEQIGHLKSMTSVVYRPYFNDYDQSQIARLALDDPQAAARTFIEGVRQRLSAASLSFGDLAGCYVETLNETIGAGTPEAEFRAVVTMDCEIAKILEQYNARAVMLNFPVGNPTEEQARLLLPAAQLCSRGHVLGFHTYWPVVDGRPDQNLWRETAMRPLLVIDPILKKHGLKPLYFFGEAGAVKLLPSGFDQHSGWRSCYPSWEAFRADLATFVSQIKEWESVNGRRVLGVALFTTNEFGAWPTFLVGHAEWDDLARRPVG